MWVWGVGVGVGGFGDLILLTYSFQGRPSYNIHRQAASIAPIENAGPAPVARVAFTNVIVGDLITPQIVHHTTNYTRKNNPNLIKIVQIDNFSKM